MAQLGMSYEWTMYYGANRETKKRARELRKRMTKAEALLWKQLRDKKVSGFKFRRQHPIEFYIVDFYCHELQLVIEIDGSGHQEDDQKTWDLNRKAEMDSFGIKELRFTNEQVIHQMPIVLKTIEEKCSEIKAKQNLFKKSGV